MSYQPTPSKIEREYYEEKLSGFIDYMYSDLKNYNENTIVVRYKHFSNSHLQHYYKKGSLKYESPSRLYRRFPEDLYELVNQKLQKRESLNLQTMTDIPVKSYLPNRPERLFMKMKRNINYYILLQDSNDFLEYKKLLLRYYFFHYNNLAYKFRNFNKKVSTKLEYYYVCPNNYSFDMTISL